jgi:hypothetical protein
LLILGLDFIKHLLDPPKPSVNPYPATFLHTQLTQVKFPINVKILPDKQYEKRKQNEIGAIKARQAKIEQQKKEAELLKSIHKNRLEQRIVLSKRRRREKKRARAEIDTELEEKKKKDENYSQFYGRIA